MRVVCVCTRHADACEPHMWRCSRWCDNVEQAHLAPVQQRAYTHTHTRPLDIVFNVAVSRPPTRGWHKWRAKDIQLSQWAPSNVLNMHCVSIEFEHLRVLLHRTLIVCVIPAHTYTHTDARMHVDLMY